jgi:hypothetical protein
MTLAEFKLLGTFLRVVSSITRVSFSGREAKDYVASRHNQTSAYKE